MVRTYFRQTRVALHEIESIDEWARELIFGPEFGGFGGFGASAVVINRRLTRDAVVVRMHDPNNRRLHRFLRQVHAYGQQIGASFDVALEPPRGIPLIREM